MEPAPQPERRSWAFVVLIVSTFALTAGLMLTWPVEASGLSFGLQAGVAVYAATVAWIAAARYRDTRDPHTLFLAAGLTVLATQALLFGVLWTQVDPVRFGESFIVGAVGVTNPEGAAISPLAWQGGWLIAAACFVLAMPPWDRRGRPPARPARVGLWAGLAVLLLDVALLIWQPTLTAAEYRAMLDESVPSAGMLGPVSWAFALGASALLFFAAVREHRARRAWTAAAFVVAIGLQALVLVRPTEGLPLVQWGDLFQPLVLALIVGGLIVAQRVEATRARRATDRAQEIVGGRAEIAGMIAHEVRGPVAAIRGLAGTTLTHYDRLSDDERKEFVGLIEQESRRLLSTVDQTSLALKIDAGSVTVDRQPADLAEAVREGVDRVDVGDHPVTIGAERGLELPIDRRHVAEIARQLVDNAAKFSPPGAPIGVIVRPTVRGAELEVIDAGPGIPAAMREQVFRKFPGWRPTGYEEQPGSGLGLFICRGLVAEHHGEISIEEGPEGGTMLRVRFPSEV
ncbi:MAG: sensor histidine kinase [Actinomycetota bacterium]